MSSVSYMFHNAVIFISYNAVIMGMSELMSERRLGRNTTW